MVEELDAQTSCISLFNCLTSPTRPSLRPTCLFVIPTLPEGEGYVPVLDHVFDLSFHCGRKEEQPVHQQDRPEHRHIKYTEESHQKCNDEGPCEGIPVFGHMQRCRSVT